MKILIAEDDFFIKDIYNQNFQKAGYEVVTANDGDEVLGILHNTTFDMILLDIMMPTINGIDVLKNIREIPSLSQQTPIFMLTNLGQEDVIKKAFTLGADGYLIKASVKPTDVVKEITAFLEKKTAGTPSN